MIFPEALVVNGIEYEVNTGYKDALACIACINDPELGEIERAYGVLELLYKEPPPEAEAHEALRLALKYLRCGDKFKPSDQKSDMDFEYDMHYIRSSFRSDYGIDLARSEMHWWGFCELLQGLTDHCILNRIRDLRNYDLSSIKDAKARSKLAKAQRDVALPVKFSQEDQDILDAFYAQLK